MATKAKKAGQVNEQKVVIPLEQTIPEIEGRKAWEKPTCHLEKMERAAIK